ncbi:SGT1-domain-containing protein [Mycena kentingensis (nom. inval.)]|nr:SGT1-domain-containing protein [Mycena kentingensis (nom. inval.)]
MTTSSIFNRPPSVADDALHYSLHPEHADKSSAASLAACISSYVDQLLPQFLWHRDAFELKIAVSAGGQTYHLEGTMRVGDCVDDEWCTVWLLKQISAKWDLAISVFDSDGEFLLIEAADELPDWVTPSNAENRVWIYAAHLHIIPLTHVSSPSKKHQRRKLPGRANSDDEDNTFDEQEEYIAVEDALSVLRDPSVDTRASPGIQNAIGKRINGYPAAAKNHVHRTKAYLPIDIARALSTDPTLVQKPVESFYTRDAIQLRAAHRMSRFPPQPSVLTAVNMTRTAYAQLVGQKFFPPKVFGQWQERELTPEWRWRDVGMKLAVGFEMLYQESKGRANSSSVSPETVQSSTDAKLEALRRNPQYIAYIQKLVAADYFRGEIEGSRLWKIFEEKAAEVFLTTLRDDDASRPSFAMRVTEAISHASATLVPSEQQLVEESDEWLNIDAKDFETMLESTMGAGRTTTKPEDAMEVDEDESPEDRIASDQAARLKNLASKVESFVEGKGDLDGALFDDEEQSDDDEELSDGMDSDSDSDDEDPARRQAAMDRLVAGIEPSEYGQMPATFHKNSQKVAPESDDNEMITPASTASKKQGPSESPSRPIRKPIIPRDRYDGVDSDDETDEEGDADSEEEDDQPTVVGDVEIDMGEEEDEFLEFSRQALGISDEQWGDILRDRKDRGAFVPPGVAVPAKNLNVPKASPSVTGRLPEPGPRPNVNPNLDSFEAVMRAMDEELSRSRTKAKSKPDAKGKGKAATVEQVSDEEDIDSAMDRELRAALERGEDDDEYEGEPPMDYNLIKNFLESFKSQGGLSGPPADATAVNNFGVARLSKFYTPLQQSAQTLVPKIFSLVYNRPPTLCNFLDAPELEAFLGPKGGAEIQDGDGRWRVVYRNYATLYFVFVVDGAESELGILDLIQVFVESLDRACENVCELDLVFQFDEVHHVLAEIIQGGLVLETNVEEISSSVQTSAKLRKESFAQANPLSLGSGVGGAGSRGGNLKSPLGWLTNKITGSRAM